MALAAELLGDRWILLILRELFLGVTRFEDIAADLSISRSVLTQRLGQMIENGLVSRQTYRHGSQRARDAYGLTTNGFLTVPVLLSLMQWGEHAITQKPAPIRIVRRTTRAQVRLEPVTTEGEAISLGEIEMQLPKGAKVGRF